MRIWHTEHVTERHSILTTCITSPKCRAASRLKTFYYGAVSKQACHTVKWQTLFRGKWSLVLPRQRRHQTGNICRFNVTKYFHIYGMCMITAQFITRGGSSNYLPGDRSLWLLLFYDTGARNGIAEVRRMLWVCHKHWKEAIKSRVPTPPQHLRKRIHYAFACIYTADGIAMKFH